jgi:uncharacterized membrane protein
MDIAIWSFSIVLALFFAAAGYMKVFRPIKELRSMPWTSNYADRTIRLIGIAELLGAIGLVAPKATNILTWVSGVAGVCLAILMFGATATHAKIKDPVSAAVTSAVLASASFALAILVFATNM